MIIDYTGIGSCNYCGFTKEVWSSALKSAGPFYNIRESAGLSIVLISVGRLTN